MFFNVNVDVLNWHGFVQQTWIFAWNRHFSSDWEKKCICDRDAKGRKVSGNFGNFPGKVSGILKGWEFSEIFNFDLFSTF